MRASTLVAMRATARHQLAGVHDHLTLADVGQMLVQHPFDAFQNAGLPVNNGLLASNAVLQGRAGGEGAQTVIHAGLVKGTLVVADGLLVILLVHPHGKADAASDRAHAQDQGKDGVRCPQRTRCHPVQR